MAGPAQVKLPQAREGHECSGHFAQVHWHAGHAGPAPRKKLKPRLAKVGSAARTNAESIQRPPGKPPDLLIQKKLQRQTEAIRRDADGDGDKGVKD